MKIKSIAFPKMHKEKGERRDFVPFLFKSLSKYKNVNIYLENNYGEDMGISKEEYLKVNPNVHFVDHKEVYSKDAIIVLRAPSKEELNLMKPRSVLVSMLHYDTRIFRNSYMRKKGIIPFSMDSIVDDNNNRMVVNYWSTAFSGAQVAFNELKNRMPNFYSPQRKPINISIIGFGKVGIQATKSFKKLSNMEFIKRNANIPGLKITILTRSITRDEKALSEILSDTDILVDVTNRRDASRFIIPNNMINVMPKHSIILDLTADPYDTKIEPIQVKAIEGIPTGTLDKYVIEPDDSDYDSIPDGINTTFRRLVVSCNAWPGVYPKEAMEIYSKQMLPFIELLIKKDPQLLDILSDNIFERALAKSSLEYFLNNNGLNNIDIVC